MRTIGITGHQGLPEAVAAEVDARIRRRLNEPVLGVSCLADGADQIFARAVLDAGGRITVIVPADQYRDGLAEHARPGYDQLLARADSIHQLHHVESTEQSHLDASAEMLDRVDELWAVWDGQPARGYGGTADVVALARERGLPVTVFWPDGASRDR
ncbi:hypothetical protein Athai_00310 [Actinocatenispora thailandica]|uniref:DUF1273 domain-containing protein n=1 Tax=Actinocatenispora thailandica TaxID=227318 RepID=A0A7R7HUV5_9ACTN|nr:hypothetical protein [Actinocatenispora thailandica]BCJ32528.1 hypothetical protein Athai_00310 [Actinocatenispora thailandica]